MVKRLCKKEVFFSFLVGNMLQDCFDCYVFGRRPARRRAVSAAERWGAGGVLRDGRPAGATSGTRPS